MAERIGVTSEIGPLRAVICHTPGPELLAVTQQLEKLEKDNRKMQKTLDKYREKWEALKAGAKARREGKSGVDSVEYAAA